MSIPFSNLVEMLDYVAGRRPNRTAIIFGAKKITYQQLISYSKKLASSLVSLGVKPKDRVALWLPNCPEFIYGFFATLRLGATVVPINTMLTREEVRFIIEDSKSKALICSIGKLADAENILSRSDNLKKVLCHPRPHNNNVMFGLWPKINEADELEKVHSIKPSDLAQIIYTSGTTGKPKGACLSHYNLLSNVKSSAEAIRANHRDCTICVLPLFHSFASTVCMLLPFFVGGRTVIMMAVRPFKRVIRAIFKHRVTIFVGVPSFFSILSEAKFPKLGLMLSYFINPIRVCICGAAALPLAVSKKFEKRIKRPLLQGYGLTEAAPVVTLNPLSGKRIADSIGVAVPDVKVRIVDKGDKDVPCGDVGELIVKGPNVMQGYFNLEEETKKALKGGWLYTGDLAKKDKDGFFYIMGRSKEMINVRGLNVYPREIEDVLYRHPFIDEAAVCGLMHRHRGEVPVAFVVPKKELSEREIKHYLRANLASYKIPLRIFFKEILPKNPTGKILKRVLQEEVKSTFS